MASQNETDHRPISAEEAAAGIRAGRGGTGFDGWLERHADLVAVAIVVLALAARLVLSLMTYLHPDEALHFLLVDHSSPAAAYRVSLANAHPPLYFALLYLWRFVGNSEFVLRLFSVLAGTAALWVAYRWLVRLLGRAGALAGLVLLGFMPSMISLAAQVRHYALLLLFAAAALYFYERSFQEDSGRMMGCFGLFLCLAALVHYSALILVVGLGLHALLRLVIARARRGLVLSWVGSQVAVIAVYAVLYVTHISRMRASVMAQQAMGDWLRTSYFDPSTGSAVGFAVSAVAGVFRFLFGSPAAGIVGLVLFAAAVVVAFLPWWSVHQQPRLRASTGLFLLLPVLAGCGFGLARLLPFGGTRHIMVLAPVAGAGIALLLGRLAGRRGSLALVGAVVAVVAMNLAAVPNPQDIRPENQRRGLMMQAIAYVRGVIPAGAIVYVDDQTRVLLGYYLGRSGKRETLAHKGQLIEFEYGGTRIVSAGTATWNFTDRDFPGELDRLAEAYELGPGTTVWVVDAGCYPRLTPAPDDVTFGGNIAVLRRTVGGGADVSGSMLAIAAELAARGAMVNTSLWPGAVLTDDARQAAAAISDRAMTFADAYRLLGRGRLEFTDLLPALAFWQFNTGERHPEMMQYMDDRENYISAGYRFTLLMFAPDSQSAVYLIDEAENDNASQR